MNFIDLLKASFNSNGARGRSFKAHWNSGSQRLARFFLLPLLLLAALIMPTAQAWSESAGCALVNADWADRSDADLWWSYPATMFEAGDQISFIVREDASEGGGYLNIGNVSRSHYYVIYSGGNYSSGDASTVIFGPQLTSDGVGIYIYGNPAGVTHVTVTCTAAAAPIITTQSSNSTVSAGGNTTFSVTASNATTYQWQVDNGGGFTNVTDGGVYSGATTATLTITGAVSVMTGYRYRVLVAGDTAPPAVSNPATLTVVVPPAITGHPANSVIQVGGNTTFTVTATNALSYQWQVNDGSGFTNISNGGIYSGATTATLTVDGATLIMSGNHYRVVVSGAAASSATSSPATLNVFNPATITAQPAGSTIAAGGNTTFSVTATNAISYQWQVDNGAGFTNMANGGVYSGATTATLTVTGATAGMSGNRYRVVISGDGATSAISSPATLNVLNSASITAQPSGSTIEAGGTTTFSITATNATGYQWQVNTGTGFTNVSNGGVYSGATTATLTITGATANLNGYVYRVVVTGLDLPHAISSAATLTVNSPPVITQQPFPAAAEAGDDVIFYVAASNATAYRWQVNTGSGFTDISNGGPYSGATTSVLFVRGATVAMDGYQYRVVVTGLASPAATSNAVLLTVVAKPAVTAHPAASTVVAGGTTTFSVTAVNATGYQWQVQTGNGFTNVSNGGAYSGANTATLTISGATTAMSTYGYRVLVSGTAAADVISNAAALRVNQASPTLGLSAPASSQPLGAPVTFVASLANGSSPSGTITFMDGSTLLGTGTLSGNAATFTTSALSLGTRLITAEYAGDADNAAATSPAVTVTVGQAVPTVSVSTSEANPTFGATVTFTATLAGGVSPGGTVTFKDGATTLGTRTISGSTATFSTSVLTLGPHSIAVEYGGDANNAAATSSAVTVTVRQTVVFAFTPAGGALPAAMAGEDYRQSISATGGTGAVIYSIASGALPAGLVLNISTGELTGPLDETASVKDYSFTIEVRDGNGSTGAASYTIKVTECTVTVTDKEIDVAAGGPPNNVNLQEGATGGPFADADVVFVEPAHAGTASIVRGEFADMSGVTPLGWYLKFVPNPSFSGTARVGFRLTSALGVSNSGVVTYTLGYDPARTAEEIDGLVRGFVQTRQNMIASTIKVPGLQERRQMANAVDPVTARLTPSGDGMAAAFSTSLAQMEAAQDSADGIAGGHASPFNIWIDGALMAHNRDENGGKWGGFGMLNLGADYLLSEKALIGISFHYDRMTDPTDQDTELTGNGWLAGPYASLEIGKGVFWDTSLLYGGSANDIDTTSWDGSFDTTRWMIDTAIKGEWKIDEVTVLTPKLRAVYFNEKVEDYTVRNATSDELTIDGFDAEQFRLSLGAEIARSFTLDDGSRLTPKLGVTGGYAGLDGSGAYGSFTAGLALETAESWMLDTSLLFNIEGDGQKSAGGRVRAAKSF